MVQAHDDSSILRRRSSTAEPHGLLLFYLALLIGIPSMLVFQPLGAGATPAALLGTAFLVLWLAAQISGMPGLIRPGPVHLVMMLFTASVLVSYVISNMHVRTPLETRSADRAVLLVMAWVGVVFFTADGLRTRLSINRVIQAVVLGGTLLAFLGCVQFFTGLDIARWAQIPGLTPRSTLAFIQERSGFRRVAGTAGHPIEFGVTLSIILPLAIHLALQSRGHKHRFAIWAGVLVIAAAIPMSLSRSATLGVAVGCLVLFMGFTRRERRIALLIAPVFLVAMRFLVPGLLGTLRSLFQNVGSDPSIQGRTQDYSFVSQFFDESPVFGRGFGTFLPELYTTLDNQYLGQVIETGLVGMAALLLVFLVPLFCARGARRRSSDPEQRSLAQALAASMAAAMVTFVTFDGLAFPMVTGVIFLLIGCIGALWRVTVVENGYGIASRWADHPRPDPRDGRSQLPASAASH